MNQTTVYVLIEVIVFLQRISFEEALVLAYKVNEEVREAISTQ